MIIAKGDIQALDGHERRYEDEVHEAYWKGIVYVPAVGIGQPSVREFLQATEAHGAAQAKLLLRGQFFLAFRRKVRGCWQAFIDNSGIFDAFHSKSAVGTSFLSLARHEKAGSARLSVDSTVEWMNCGYVYESRTLLDGINKLTAEKIVTSCPDGTLKIDTVRVPSLEDPWDGDPFDFFEKFAASAREERISADLTGGVDSRLLAVLLDHCGLEFETATSGVHGFVDVEIATKVAALMGKEHHLSRHSLDDLNDSVPKIFLACDGLYDVFLYHRIWQNQCRRLDRGISMVVSGVGGELFKDSFWLHDFPRYQKKDTNLWRLVRWRMAKVLCDDSFFGETFRRGNRELRGRLVEVLQRYVMPTNTQTFDNISFAYHATAEAGRLLAAGSNVVPIYAPLVDLDLVRYGFHMPRRKRFFNNFHREMITTLNPRLARIPTAEGGMTVSSRLRHVVPDAMRYVCANASWASSVVFQKFVHRPYGLGSVNHPDLSRRIRTYPGARRFVGRLKEEGVVAGPVDFDKIGDPYLGRCITLGMLPQHLDGQAQRSCLASKGDG